MSLEREVYHRILLKKGDDFSGLNFPGVDGMSSAIWPEIDFSCDIAIGNLEREREKVIRWLGFGGFLGLDHLVDRRFGRLGFCGN